MSHDTLMFVLPFGTGYALAMSLGTQISMWLALIVVGLIIVRYVYQSFKDTYLMKKKLKEEAREVK